MTNVVKFPANREPSSRQHADSTGIALQLVGTAFVFGVLCVFGWPHPTDRSH
jgi:hypothetical protein